MLMLCWIPMAWISKCESLNRRRNLLKVFCVILRVGRAMQNIKVKGLLGSTGKLEAPYYS